MDFSKTNTIGIIGSGAMGSGIAQVAASAGENVIMFDSNSSMLEKAKENLNSTLKKLSEKGKVSAEVACLLPPVILLGFDLLLFKGLDWQS